MKILRRDFKRSNQVLKRDVDKVIASNRKAIMGHVNELDTRVKKVEVSVATVPEMVKVVMKNMDNGSADLKKN